MTHHGHEIVVQHIARRSPFANTIQISHLFHFPDAPFHNLHFYRPRYPNSSSLFHSDLNLLVTQILSFIDCWRPEKSDVCLQVSQISRNHSSLFQAQWFIHKNNKKIKKNTKYEPIEHRTTARLKTPVSKIEHESYAQRYPTHKRIVLLIWRSYYHPWNIV